MRNTLLRIVIRSLLFSLAAGIIVSVIGLVIGWTTPTQFSDGFFWAGAIIICIGFISFQGYSQREANWPSIHLDPDERATLWGADIFRGKNLMIACGISGLLLVGLSSLVTRLF